MIKYCLALPLLLSVPLLSACVNQPLNAPTQKEPIMQSLEGSEWGLETNSETFIAFKEEGRLFGFAGCNRLFGSYNYAHIEGSDKPKLTISQIGLTKKACAKDIMRTETDFINKLTRSTHAIASHLSLSLYAKDGTHLISFQRRDWD